MAGCKACGDKPEKNRTFPPAVIEINNPEQLVLLRKVIIPTSLGDDAQVPPAIGKYHNVILQYEANGHIYLYSSDGIPTKIDATVPQEVLDRITTLESDVSELERNLTIESDTRERADVRLQQEIDDLKNSPDVVDIVATYADLMAYDTSGLGDNDVIRVLRDETHEGQSSYYRWSTSTHAWTFIGTVGDYYTKQQVDILLDEKQDELIPGENISIVDESGSLVISATDTTYTFDNTPTAGSDNPVTSQGIKSYVDTHSVTFKPFPDSVVTNGTTQQFMNSIRALQPTVGMAYLGTVDLSDAPEGFIQEEVEVYVYSDYVLYCIMRSTDIAPYEWWCSSYNYQGWQPVNTDTTYTAGYGLELNGTEFSVDPDIVQDTLTAGDNITIEDESGSLVISATDTTYSAGSGLNLTGTTFSVDTTTIPTQSELTAALADKQDVLTAGDNIAITDESGALVISADDGLAPTTTFWGQTANNGSVDGTITISGTGGLPGMSLGGGYLNIDKPAVFYLRAKKGNTSAYSNVLWWHSASNNVPSDVHLDAAETRMTLKTNEVKLDGRYPADNVKISNVATPQNNTDAANKSYVDNNIPAIFTTNEWNALWA